MKNTLMMKNGNNLLPNYPEGHNLLLIKNKDIRQIYAENTIKNGIMFSRKNLNWLRKYTFFIY